MPKKARNGGIWAYLDACGVLEKGTEAEILDAKKEYHKKYMLDYRRRQRKEKPEFVVSLSKRNGDYFKVNMAAKEHKMPITAFIRLAALAYIDKTYIVPDRLMVAELRQLLSACLNEIQSIVVQKEKYFWGKEQKFKDIENHIEKLETELMKKLEQPITLDEVIKKEIEKEPGLKDRLTALIQKL